MKEQIKSRILVEMQSILNREQLQELKMCLDRNLYNVVIESEYNELIINHYPSNEEMIKRYYADLVISGKSDKTIEQYMNQIGVFFSMVNKNWHEVNKDDIVFFLGSLLKNGKIKKVSIDNKRRCVKTFFNFLEDNDYITRNPFKGVSKVKYEQKKKEYLTDDEVIKIRDCVIENGGKKKIRDLAIIDFLLSTGVRVSEFVNLKQSDVDLNNGTVNVYATKTREWRTVYLDSNAKKHLIDYLNTRNDYSEYLFTNNKKKLSNSAVENVLHKYGRKSHINKHCSVHLFRKTLATKLYKKGMDVSKIAKILGHHSVKTTELYYLTVCEEDVRYTYKSLC